MPRLSAVECRREAKIRGAECLPDNLVTTGEKGNSGAQSNLFVPTAGIAPEIEWLPSR